MAKRGRKPTPTPTLKLRNAFRSDRHGDRIDNENIDQKRPSCPRRLISRQKNADAEVARRAAKGLWDHLATPLHKAGLLVELYRMPFEMLCDSFGRWVLACERCNAEGMTSESTKGTPIRSPWVSIRNDMWKQVAEMAGRFGLTPSDLAGVRGLPKPVADTAKRKFFLSNDSA